MKTIAILLMMAIACFVFTGCASKSAKINNGQLKKHIGIHHSHNSNVKYK